MVVGRFHRHCELIVSNDPDLYAIRNLELLLQVFNYMCEFTNAAVCTFGGEQRIGAENKGQSHGRSLDRSLYSGEPAHIYLDLSSSKCGRRVPPKAVPNVVFCPVRDFSDV